MDLGWNEISIEQRDKIHQLIITHVKENHCCRVGWACKDIMGREVQGNVLDKVAARVVKEGNYIKETANINFKYDWNIRENSATREKTKDRLIGVAITISAVFLGAFLNHILLPKPQSKIVLPPIQIVHDTVYVEKNRDTVKTN